MRGRDLVGANLRRLRVERHVSQERLAFDAGVDRSYVGGMERVRKTRPSMYWTSLPLRWRSQLASCLRRCRMAKQRVPGCGAGESLAKPTITSRQ